MGGSEPRYKIYNPPVKIGSQTYIFPPKSTTYWYSGDDGSTWYKANNPNLGESHFGNVVQIGSHWYVRTSSNGLLRGNVNNQNLVGPISGTQGLVGRGYPTEINNKIYWNTSTGVYVSKDNGVNVQIPIQIGNSYYFATGNKGLWTIPIV